MTVTRGVTTGLALAALLAACGGDGAEQNGAAADTSATAADTGVVVAADAGLSTPESVLHDDAADVYLVSNINGQPLERDDNGFISRLRPDGSVVSLKWIDGAAENVTLNAPKGMALKGDTLFVTDIDSVRAFHREGGQPLGARGVPNADFLNDLVVVGDVLYVSDTGVDATFSPTGSAAIYRFTGTGAEVVARGDSLASPNGLAAQGGRLLVASFGSADVRRIDPGQGGAAGAGEVVATLPGGQLDGIIAFDDGSFLVSSWETSTVYHVTPAGEAHPVVQDVESPADIGWDARRGRVLIPLFMRDRVEFHPIASRQE
ncbi:MAG TPA: hypothetical protein VMM12_05735 [Longimicrobiales bacterium]|nr:hypothetical protein [Longimicrobiales bacterium]